MWATASSPLCRMAPERLVGKKLQWKGTYYLFRAFLNTTRNIWHPRKSEKIVRSTVVPTYLWESKVCAEDYAEWDRSPAPAVLQTNAVHTGQLSAGLVRGESLKSESSQIQAGSPRFFFGKTAAESLCWRRREVAEGPWWTVMLRRAFPCADLCATLAASEQHCQVIARLSTIRNEPGFFLVVPSCRPCIFHRQFPSDFPWF